MVKPVVYGKKMSKQNQIIRFSSSKKEVNKYHLCFKISTIAQTVSLFLKSSNIAAGPAAKNILIN